MILTLGGGDITTLPDELLARRARRRLTWARSHRSRRSSRRGCPGRVEPDAPFGALTTWRVGGPAAVLVRVEARRRPRRRSPSALPARRCRVLVLGRGSNLLVADAGFAGRRRRARRRVRGDRPSATTTVTAGGATALPVLARQCAAAGRAGLEFYVGIPGSVGGAVRMNAGGHGRETVEVLVDAHRRRPRRRRATRWCGRSRRSPSATATRRSPTTTSWSRPASASRPATRRRCAAELRRDRALADRAPARRRERRARCSATRRATRAARLIDAEAGLHGTAGRRRGGLGEARQLHPGRAGRDRGGCPPIAGAGARPCGGGDRGAPRPRGAPDRLRGPMTTTDTTDTDATPRTPTRRPAVPTGRPAIDARRTAAVRPLGDELDVFDDVVDPRLRARWVAARRAEGRRRLYVICAVVGTVAARGHRVRDRPFVAARRRDDRGPRGARRRRAPAIRAAARIADGEPLLFLDEGAVARRVEALPDGRPGAGRAPSCRRPSSIRVTERVAGRVDAGPCSPRHRSRCSTGDGRVLARTDRAAARARAGGGGGGGRRARQPRGATPTPLRALAALPDALRVAGDPRSCCVRATARCSCSAGPTRRRDEVQLGSLADVRAKATAALAVLDALRAAAARRVARTRRAGARRAVHARGAC